MQFSTTIPIPEIFPERTLCLSFHVFLLGILFKNNAFLGGLEAASQLKQRRIWRAENEAHMPIRPELHETYVFRKAVPMPHGYIMSKEHTTYAVMASRIKRAGELAGIEMPTITYSIRYNSGNVLNRDSTISSARRNHVMAWANDGPFQQFYIARMVDVDLNARVRNLPPQDVLIQATCSIGYSASKRRPADLTKDQSLSVNSDPHIQKLVRTREKMRSLRMQGHSNYAEINRQITYERAKLRRELKKDIRREWRVKQAVKDTKRQLAGDESADDVETPLQPSLRGLQKRLVDALTAPILETGTDDQHRERRDNAIQAVVDYCPFEELRAVRPYARLAKPTLSPSPSINMDIDPSVDSLEEARKSVFGKKPKRCFLCVGRACELAKAERDNPQIDELIKPFYNSSVVTRHFQRIHLSKAGDGDKVECKICDTMLVGRVHLQNHAKSVHDTLPNSPRTASRGSTRKIRG